MTSSDANPSTPPSSQDWAKWRGQPAHQPLFQVARAIDAVGGHVHEDCHMQARDEQLEPTPSALLPQVQSRLNHLAPTGLWRHQSLALEAVCRGESVVLSTSTSSGKTLVFIAAAMQRMLTRTGDKRAKVLVLYPAKALIRDQLGRWQKALRPLGLRACHIDGTVRTADRDGLLRHNDVLLATPDVVHAWLLRDPTTQPFLDALRLVVLDEAHVYDGAFGSNMVYLLHRLRACSSMDQLIATTATLASPVDFIRDLTGLETTSIGPDLEGAPSYGRHFLRVASTGGVATGERQSAKTGSLSAKVDFVTELVRRRENRFLAFADSRKAVELLVTKVHRKLDKAEHACRDAVLPYRAGFEEEDRAQIQKALVAGKLRGVICTSALELGIDIGDIDVVALLSAPTSQRSLWQRVGRAGRTIRAGVCVVWGDESVFARSDLLTWLERPLEPSRLYRHNALIQFGHAICAAYELRSRGAAFRRDDLNDLPPRFVAMLDNELEPTRPLPDDFLELKARLDAAHAPHWELPLRGSTGDRYKISAQRGQLRLGEVDAGQMLREAYPGAIYHYIAQPFRILRLTLRTKEISATRVRSGTNTRPIAQTRVFPRLPEALFARRHGATMVAFESQVQVSERVMGYQERVGGGDWTQHPYGALSSYAQRPLGRTFNTTGVGWCCPEEPGSSAALTYVRRAFCRLCEIAEGDVGCGEFSVRDQAVAELLAEKGWCIYDATAGSLRLTATLLVNLQDVFALAAELATQEEQATTAEELQSLAGLAADLSPMRKNDAKEAAAEDDFFTPSPREDAVRVLAPDQDAILIDGATVQDVRVLSYHFGPRGLMYRLQREGPGRWLVPSARIRADGVDARWLWLDADTGEVLDEAA